MSKLEELLAANVKATGELVKNAKGLGTDSEGVSIVSTPSSVSGQGSAPNANNE